MTMSKHRVVTTDAEIDAAIAKAKGYEKFRPRAIRAQFNQDRDTLQITLANGVMVSIPRTLLQGLEDARMSDVSKVTIEDHGASLHWEVLDVDHYIPGLLVGVFGSREWMSRIGRKGGSARSRAKAQSSRENGKKGGRPRKPLHKRAKG